MIIIGKESSVRSLMIFRKLKKMHFDTYYMQPNDSLKMVSERLGKPIFFRVNALFKPYSLYEPKYSYPEFSIKYHEAMAKLLTQGQ